MNLKDVDIEIFNWVEKERNRQKDNLILIASENHTPVSVLSPMATWLSNKYAEGYPFKRYYGGCEMVDEVEQIAIDRLKSLYGAPHANVQPHSGTQANLSVYLALLKPGDTILSMKLSHGGHLSHGHPVNAAGKYYRVVRYGVRRDTETIDFDQVEEVAKREKPGIIVCGYSAYPRIVDFKKFREIADSIGAYLMGDIAHIAGLVATGEHPSPFPHCHVVTGTTHKTLRGPRGAFILTTSELAKKIDKAVFPGMQGGPLMHAIASKAVCFKLAGTPEFKEYSKQIVQNSKKLAETLSKRGLRLVSNGTDNHLCLVDLTPIDITGKDAETILGKAGIVVNRNTIPFETRPPTVASGIRIGTPCITTRGMQEEDMEIIGEFIGDVLLKRDEPTIERVKKEVTELTRKFPIYQDVYV